MAPFQVTCFVLIFMIHSLSAADYNQFSTSRDVDGTYRWESITPFVPIQSASFGTIPLGEIMQIQFDFKWWGRTNDPTENKFEMFFRVGFDADISKSCDGQGARYPSFWLTGNVDTMHVSASSGTQCQPSHSLNAYGIISIGVAYHVSIAFNSSALMVDISGGNKPNRSYSWPREATPSEYIGAVVPVWWMSNKNVDDLPLYNRGNGTFTNVVLTSFTPTPAPTTSSPTTRAPTSPSFAPSSTPTTAVPTTANPTIPPTVTPTNIPTTGPSSHPTTAAPTTATPTSLEPSVSPTAQPSLSPTTLPPTTTPTANPSFTPSSNPSATPSESPTENPTNSPTTSAAPTVSPVTTAPTYTGQTYSPTAQPTVPPSYEPSDNPSTVPTLEPTTNPSDLPTATPTKKPSRSPTNSTSVLPTSSPSKKPTYTFAPFITETQYIANTIEVINPIDSNEQMGRDEYEYVEITIFATVIALCFCTVISFLAYLTFKRRVREMQKKRKASPVYHMEVDGAELPSKLELNCDSKSKSSNPETGENVTSDDRNYLQSPLNKSFRKALSKSHTEEHEANVLDSMYLSLEQYKSDSAPHSHLSISVMNMKDATPTPAVSPNENTQRRITSPNNNKVALVMSHADANDITPEQTVRETVGPDHEHNIIDNEDDTSGEHGNEHLHDDNYDSEEDEKGFFDKKQRRKDNKHYEPLKRLPNKTHMLEMEEPYEQELDGYGIGLYTTPIVRNYGPYRKNTENTEGYDSDNSAEHTDFYNSYSGKKAKRKRKGGKAVRAKADKAGYEWIKKTLARVDSQNYDEYINNFRKHKVADDRLDDLLPEDWKELIPVIGPRNEFRRLWHKYSSNVMFKTNGEPLENEEATVPPSGNMAADLGNDLLTQLISDNDKALLLNEMKHKQQDIHLANDVFYSEKDVDKLTFDDIKNKFGSNSASKSNKNDNSVLSSVLSSIISNSEEDAHKKRSEVSTESMEISQSYEESQSNASEEDNRYKMNTKNKSKSKSHKKHHKNNKANPIPSAIAEDEEVEEKDLKIDKERLKPAAAAFISPPISPPQYTSHKLYDTPIIGRGKNLSNTSASSQSLMSEYSSVSAPVPNEVDPDELKEPLQEEESDSDDETLRIPKFHADVSDSDSSSDAETETESDDDTKSQTEEEDEKEFGQEVDVTIENAIYDDDDDDDDEYESEDSDDDIDDDNDDNDDDDDDEDDDDESVSIDIPKSPADDVDEW